MSQRRFVCIAAVSEYADKGMPALPGARRDAELLRTTLKNHADGGIYRICWLPDGKATKLGMLQQLQRIAKESGATDQVVVYFGGHGWLGRDADTQRWKYYLLPYDATLSSVAGSWLSTNELGSVLNTMSAEELIVILDCCHSGGIADFRWTNDILDELFEGWRSYYVMAAARGREEAGEDDSGGFFMGALCAALRGEGIVPDKDGRISAQKAWSHAADILHAEAARRGHHQTAVSGGISSPIYVTRLETSPVSPVTRNVDSGGLGRRGLLVSLV